MHSDTDSGANCRRPLVRFGENMQRTGIRALDLKNRVRHASREPTLRIFVKHTSTVQVGLAVPRGSASASSLERHMQTWSNKQSDGAPPDSPPCGVSPLSCAPQRHHKRRPEFDRTVIPGGLVVVTSKHAKCGPKGRPKQPESIRKEGKNAR